MVVRKKKKSRRLRGRTRTMGWGRIGQHRKSGSRGGFGAVGFHKHKTVWMIKYAPEWYGKHGFTSVKQVKLKKYKYYKTINVGELEELVRKLEASNAIQREGGVVVVDTVKLGYDKVLGEGEIKIPVKVIAKAISETAKKKIEEAGGIVVLIGESSEQ